MHTHILLRSRDCTAASEQCFQVNWILMDLDNEFNLLHSRTHYRLPARSLSLIYASPSSRATRILIFSRVYTQHAKKAGERDRIKFLKSRRAAAAALPADLSVSKVEKVQSEAIKSEVLFFISHFSLGTCHCCCCFAISHTKVVGCMRWRGWKKNDYLSSSPWLLLNR